MGYSDGDEIRYIRPFNDFLMRPWYGFNPARHTSLSVEHQYFFKTKAKKATPFYCLQRVSYVDEKHTSFGSHYQRLSTMLGLGIALEMRKHWGLSLDFGIAPIWWGLNNGRNRYTDDDVTERFPFWQPKIRL